MNKLSMLHHLIMPPSCSAFVLSEPGNANCPWGHVPASAPLICKQASASLGLPYDGATAGASSDMKCLQNGMKVQLASVAALSGTMRLVCYSGHAARCADVLLTLSFNECTYGELCASYACTPPMRALWAVMPPPLPDPSMSTHMDSDANGMISEDGTPGTIPFKDIPRTSTKWPSQGVHMMPDSNIILMRQPCPKFP